MYYNGYIIICIFIGAFLGAFVFQWEVIGLGSVSTEMECSTPWLTIATQWSWRNERGRRGYGLLWLIFGNHLAITSYQKRYDQLRDGW